MSKSQTLLWSKGGAGVANVVLLAGFEGANNSTATSDESPAAHGAATFVHSAKISTAQAKAGSSSLLVTSATADYITWPDSNDWNFSNGKFTVEAFIYPNTLSGNQFVVSQWDSSLTSDAWVLWCNGSTLAFNCSTAGSDNVGLLTGGTVTTGVWHHVACDFDSTTYRLYLDGVKTSGNSVLRTFFDSIRPLAVGSDSTGTFNFNGYVDELRITKGVARYATDTSFTVPTVPFPRS